MLTADRTNCAECESLSDGTRTALAGDGHRIKVRITPPKISSVGLTDLTRDPTKHHTLKDEIEEQSTALYASARLWDDGVSS